MSIDQQTVLLVEDEESHNFLGDFNDTTEPIYMLRESGLQTASRPSDGDLRSPIQLCRQRQALPKRSTG